MIVPDGMLDPQRMDPADRPFSYYAHPTDLIGAMYAPLGSEVTPEGYLYTGYGELLFLVGNPPEPIDCRIKTLHRGYLPIVEFDFEREGVRYAYRLFAADLGGPLSGLPVNFAEVTAENCCGEPRAAFLGAACRHRGASNTAYPSPGDFRFGQRAGLVPPALLEGQQFGQTEQRYTFSAEAVLRDGRLVYSFPADPSPHCQSVALMDSGLRMRRYFSGEIEGEPDPKHTLSPDEPAGVVLHRLLLAPGESRSLVYRQPIVPLSPDSAEADLLRAADPQRLLGQTVELWEERVARPAPLRLPEEKVQQYLLANTINNLLGFDRVGEDLIPSVNKFHYHAYYGGGNVNDIMASLEFMGQLEICRQGLLFLCSRQFPDGSFRLEFYPEGVWWEMWGYNVWGLARHYRLTRDEDFLRLVYPVAVRAMAWQDRITSGDALGLWPPATIADDAYLKNCRQTGQAIWGLVGILSALRLAAAIGNAEDEARFRGQYERFRAAFDAALARQTELSGGYICPALERTTAGNDWDNLLMLYPERLFDPLDPRVTETLRVVRGKYQEGVLGYTWPCATARRGEQFTFNEQPGLHYWQTPNNTQTSLVRGSAEDQEWAVRELYAMLLHTSSTHMTGEFGTIPWSTRDCSHVHNIIPQGTSAAKTIQALRNMLLREQDADLYLLSAVSPEWLRPGQVIEVREAPSTFGPLSFRLEAASDRLTLTLPTAYRHAPERLLVRVPWFWALTRAEADGRGLAVDNGHLVAPPGSAELVLLGGVAPDTEPLSYAHAVEAYKAEYRRRYEHFKQTGSRE